MSLGLLLGAIAQEPLKEKISLAENEQLYQVFKYKEEGIIVISTLFSGEKSNNSINIRFFSLDYKVKWEKNIKMHYEDKNPNINLTYSTYSDYFYVIENKAYPTDIDRILCDPAYITQIDKNGSLKGTEFKEFLSKDVSGDIAIVATKSYLNVYRVNLKESKVILYKISNSDLTVTNVEIPFNDVKIPKDNLSTTSFWHFVAQTEDEIYFARNEYKSFAKSGEPDYKFNIASVNEDGKILSNISFNPSLKGCFPLASTKINFEGPITSGFQTINYNSSQGTSYIYVYAVGNITYDLKNNSVYISGMMSRKYKKASLFLQKPEGYYLVKFDLQGNKKWQIIKDFDKDYQNNLGVGPSMRFLNVLNGILQISGNFIDAKDLLYVNFDNDGNVVKSSIHTMNDYLMSFSDNLTPVQKYVKSLNLDESKLKPEERKVMLTQYFTTRDVLIEYNPKVKTIEIISFTKE